LEIGDEKLLVGKEPLQGFGLGLELADASGDSHGRDLASDLQLIVGIRRKGLEQRRRQFIGMTPHESKRRKKKTMTTTMTMTMMMILVLAMAMAMAMERKEWSFDL
jgi:hypothetical protein